MTAITDLTQLTGKAAEIKWLKKSQQPNPLNILLLGDGFVEDEQNIFDEFADNLINRFLRIAPFCYCRPYINIFSCYTPSTESGIRHETNSGAEWRTVYRVYLNDKENLQFWDYTRVVEVVKKLILPSELQLPDWLNKTTDDIWFNSLSKSHGAVGIIANTDQGGGFNKGQITTTVNESIGRYFVFGMHGYKPRPNQLQGKYLHSFIHELAHSLRLGDEYERYDISLISPSDAQQLKNRYANIAYIDSIQDFTSIPGETFLESTPWKHLMTYQERERIIDGRGIFFKRHLMDMGIIGDVNDEDKRIHRNVPRLNIPVHWSQINLIEGAWSNRFFYRSNFECRMRHYAYCEALVNSDPMNGSPNDYQRVVGGVEEVGSPEFCRVCNYQIRHHITGYTEYGIGGVNRNRLSLVFHDEIMPRIIESFRIQNIVSESELSVARAYCHIASIRAYIMFKNIPEKLDVTLNIKKEHVSIFYKGIICDPTFFDLYRLESGNEPVASTDPLGDSDLHYEPAIDEKIPFKNWQVNRGFAGTPGEIKAFIYSHRMQKGSFGNQTRDWADHLHPGLSSDEIFSIIDESIDEIIDANYGKNDQYPGPDNSEYDKIDKTKFNFFGMNYIDVIKNEWDRWITYKNFKKDGKDLPNDKSLNYLIPLDMSISLLAVLNGQYE